MDASYAQGFVFTFVQIAVVGWNEGARQYVITQVTTCKQQGSTRVAICNMRTTNHPENSCGEHGADPPDQTDRGQRRMRLGDEVAVQPTKYASSALHR